MYLWTVRVLLVHDWDYRPQSVEVGLAEKGVGRKLLRIKRKWITKSRIIMNQSTWWFNALRLTSSRFTFFACSTEIFVQITYDFDQRRRKQNQRAAHRLSQERKLIWKCSSISGQRLFHWYSISRLCEFAMVFSTGKYRRTMIERKTAEHSSASMSPCGQHETRREWVSRFSWRWRLSNVTFLLWSNSKTFTFRDKNISYNFLLIFHRFQIIQDG